jgi:NADPH-dependent stearoyl-CoA 9-desaturase
MRIDPHQKWHPFYLLQPLYNLILMGFFEWGVAVHDLNRAAIHSGEKSKEQVVQELKAIGAKARDQIVKDYVAFPALAALAAFVSGRGSVQAGRRSFKTTLAANFTANIVRNVWSYSIIFCGHFPDQTYTFSQEEVAEETRGGFFVRQLLGAANIDGGPLFHLLAGNLSFQVEHHLYPDMPSSRYAEIAPRVRDICRRFGLPYNTGPLHKQLGTVHRTILRLAFPGGRVRPKPGAYKPS